MNKEEYDMVLDGTVCADRMALGLPAITDRLRGDMDAVKRWRDTANQCVTALKAVANRKTIGDEFDARKLVAAALKQIAVAEPANGRADLPRIDDVARESGCEGNSRG